MIISEECVSLCMCGPDNFSFTYIPWENRKRETLSQLVLFSSFFLRPGQVWDKADPRTAPERKVDWFPEAGWSFPSKQIKSTPLSAACRPRRAFNPWTSLVSLTWCLAGMEGIKAYLEQDQGWLGAWVSNISQAGIIQTDEFRHCAIMPFRIVRPFIFQE